MNKVRDHHRRAQIYSFVLRYKKEHDGNSPSYREIMVACGIPSASIVQWHLRQLDRAGKIRWSARTPRTIEIVGGEWRIVA